MKRINLSRRAFAKLMATGGLGAAAATLPACSSRTDALETGETIKFTVFSQLANWSGDQIGWGGTLLKDLFNVELMIIPDTDGAYQTRMESGNLGDIVVWGSNGDEYQYAVERGMLFNWDEDDVLGTYGAELASTFPIAIESNKELNPDGRCYGIGNSLTDEPGEHGLFIYDWGLRWDLYQQIGYPEVNSLDDLAEALKQMQAACPTGDDGKKTYACSIWPDWDGNMVMYVKAMASAYYGYDELGIGHYDATNGNFLDCLDADSPYMESLQFFNKLYREGLLDPDSMTQTFDTMYAKVQAGDVLFSIFNYAGSIPFNTAEHVAENKYMAPLVPTGASVIVNGLSTVGEGRIWSIGNKCVYPEKAMEILNWLYTPEGCLTNLYGPKGLMWDYDASGKTYFTELGQTCYEDSAHDLTGVEWTSPYTGETYTLTGTFSDGSFQFNNTTWADGAINPDSAGERFNQETWESRQGDPKNATDADWREYTGATGTQEYLNTVNFTVVPAVNWAESTRDSELELKWQQVIKAIKEGSWKAMYAGSDAEFESIVSDMRSSTAGYGYDECVAWCAEESAKRFALQQEEN